MSELIPIEQLGAVVAEYPQVAAVYLFGSLQRGTATASSDVDLGLVLGRGLDGENLPHRLLGELAARLEQLVAPRSVDLVVLSAKEPFFCYQVLLEARLVYEGDRERRIDFESESYIRGLDFAQTFALATRDYLTGYRTWLRSYRNEQRDPAPA